MSKRKGWKADARRRALSAELKWRIRSVRRMTRRIEREGYTPELLVRMRRHAHWTWVVSTP